MSFGIYKLGQGYWVRVLTASLLAVVALGAAQWAAGQTARFESNLPRSTFALALGDPEGTVAVNDRVTLVAKPEAAGATAKELGTARVSSYDAANGELRVDDVKIEATDADPSMASTVRKVGFEAPVKVVTGVPPIEPQLLIGLVVSVVLLLGAGFAYFLTAVKPGAVDFLIATDMEMKKVNWTSRKEIIGSTWVVIGACVLIAGFLYGMDRLIAGLFQWMGLLVNAG